jgi:hypothetical protein
VYIYTINALTHELLLSHTGVQSLSPASAAGNLSVSSDDRPPSVSIFAGICVPSGFVGMRASKYLYEHTTQTHGFPLVGT